MKPATYFFLICAIIAVGNYALGYQVAKHNYKCDQVGGTSSAYGQKVNGVFKTDEHTYKICK